MTQTTEFERIDVEDALKKLSISNKIALLGGKVRFSFTHLSHCLSSHSPLHRISGVSKMCSRDPSRFRPFEPQMDLMEFEDATSTTESLPPAFPVVRALPLPSMSIKWSELELVSFSLSFLRFPISRLDKTLLR